MSHKRKKNSIDLDKIRVNKERVSKIRDREIRKKGKLEESKKKSLSLDKVKIKTPVKKSQLGGRPATSYPSIHKR